MTISALAAIAALFIFVFTMVYASVTDLTNYKIRNGLVLLFLLAYAVLAPYAGFTAYEIGWSVAIAAGAFLFTFLFFALGWIGGVGPTRVQPGNPGSWAGLGHAGRVSGNVLDNGLGLSSVGSQTRNFYRCLGIAVLIAALAAGAAAAWSALSSRGDPTVLTVFCVEVPTRVCAVA